MAELKLDINGAAHTVQTDPACPLLFVLTDALGLGGPRFGCGLGECGSCTVLLDGEPVRSCVLPAAEAKGKIVTLEGLGTEENPHPVQRAFSEEEALQCGFCISGLLLTGMTFMDKNPGAGAEQIEEALRGVRCRCYAHGRMVQALLRYGRERGR